MVLITMNFNMQTFYWFIYLLTRYLGWSHEVYGLYCSYCCMLSDSQWFLWIRNWWLGYLWRIHGNIPVNYCSATIIPLYYCTIRYYLFTLCCVITFQWLYDTESCFTVFLSQTGWRWSYSGIGQVLSSSNGTSTGKSCTFLRYWTNHLSSKDLLTIVKHYQVPCRLSRSLRICLRTIL